ncbi:MAG: phenylalanine--tRNA ligase subunit alpha [Flavobacteriales bacterium]|nr:phenylalanine--tRNA ligase subunit alpha [Flavobacteriales bacterium]
MLDKIKQYIEETGKFKAENAEKLEEFRIHWLGRKGVLKSLFEDFKNVPNEMKKDVGQAVNTLRNQLEQIVENQKDSFSTATSVAFEDYTRPTGFDKGSKHPVSVVRREILEIFSHIGFKVAEGPEIEDDWHVFSGLNFPPEHPARDMQDTFFIERDPDILLRTHTSSVQVRAMKENQPPIRIVMPGRVFRNEAISSRSHCIFHQIEGLYIDEGVSFADLKQTLMFFAKEFFGKSKIRLRPSYFPFTEPSAEVDVYWGLNSETDYRITKGTGWLEILGCGMVDPNVLASSNIDPEKYSGFAFGMGIERIAMLRYQIDDIRLLFENDVRFLNQFQSI